MFAGQPPRADDERLFGVPLFLDPSQEVGGERGARAGTAEWFGEFMATDPALLDE
jgi:hypothetical protein